MCVVSAGSWQGTGFRVPRAAPRAPSTAGAPSLPERSPPRCSACSVPRCTRRLGPLQLAKVRPCRAPSASGRLDHPSCQAVRGSKPLSEPRPITARWPFGPCPLSVLATRRPCRSPAALRCRSYRPAVRGSSRGRTLAFGRGSFPRPTVTPRIGQYWALLTNLGHLDHAGLVACARPVAAATAPPHGTALPVTQGALVPQSGQVASREQSHPLSAWRLSRHEAEHQTGCLVAEPSAVVGTARLVPRWSAFWATPSPRASAPVVWRTCAQRLAPGRAHEPRMV
jgi:hypothetical protein